MKDNKVYNLKLTKEEIEVLPLLERLAEIYTWELYEKTEASKNYKQHNENMKLINEYHNKGYQGFLAVANNIIDKINKLTEDDIYLRGSRLDILTLNGSSSMDINKLKEELKKYESPNTYTGNYDGALFISSSAYNKEVCIQCSNNPSNGGSGTCNCTL